MLIEFKRGGNTLCTIDANKIVCIAADFEYPLTKTRVATVVDIENPMTVDHHYGEVLSAWELALATEVIKAESK